MNRMKVCGVAALCLALLGGVRAVARQAPAAVRTPSPTNPAGPYTGMAPDGGARVDPGRNLLPNPYRLVMGWPTLNPGMKWAGTTAFLPDNQGGVWMLFRGEPTIIHFNAAGKIVQSFGEPKQFVHSHGFCRDRDGNFWAGDSGPSGDNPAEKGHGFQVFKFSPEGKVLLTLGKKGVSQSGPDTFLGPTACIQLANGDMLFADGHWPRPSYAPQDGDRLVRYTKDGQYVRDYGKLGTGPGEFMGPHGLALDSQGRLFVADRSNNRLQIFDRDMNYLDSWRHFGRPSGVWILKDDRLFVADSESGGLKLGGPKESLEGAAPAYRNIGWKQGIWLGSAKDGSVRGFIDGTNPEGMAVDEKGTIYAGLTAGCPASRSGGCLQKWVPVR